MQPGNSKQNDDLDARRRAGSKTGIVRSGLQASTQKTVPSVVDPVITGATKRTSGHGFPVLLHVYDLGPVSKILLNSWASHQKDSKLGAFHCGVEVLGIEWSYQALSGCRGDGDSATTGITWHQPRSHPRHVFRETVELGTSPLHVSEISKLLDDLSKTWLARAYHFITHNCTDFAHHFCETLLAPNPFPPWVHGLAKGLLQTGPVVSDPRSSLFFNTCASCGSYDVALCGSVSGDAPPEPIKALAGIGPGGTLLVSQPMASHLCSDVAAKPEIVSAREDLRVRAK
eukprot:TRINITY_DN78428_c0_g1_i1.p1 TRINITY_DN78428_c0_g1~~TRINITY_DN78428_c0_g1_i1.p1  ORF type:complete len:307 (-),score=22.84 TRINITY_DN78428_c0_g1_i1:307-1164(-)